MIGLTRRSLLRSSLGLAASGTLARPYIANAAAKTANVWWAQGFIPEEDASFRNMVAAYEKAIQLRPGFWEAHSNLGLIRHEEGNLAEAVAEYREAKRISEVCTSFQIFAAERISLTMAA